MSAVLVGDVGGTNSRFALYDGALGELHGWPTAETPSLSEALRRLRHRGLSGWTAAAVAVAGPVTADSARLTNTPWVGHLTDFGVPACFLNDLAAAARGVDAVHPTHRVELKGGVVEPGAPVAVLGLGTGLGEAYRVGDQVVGGEGGHRTFAPETAQQRALFDAVTAEVGRPATWEHVLAGAGLGRIAAFLDGAALRGDHNARASAVTAGTHPQAGPAIAMYARLCAAEARGQALQVLARGGVYLVGGMPGRLPVDALREGFASAFVDGGPHAGILRKTPVYAVLDTRVGLLGAAAVAQALAAAK